VKKEAGPAWKGRGRAKALKNVLGVGGFRESHTNQTEFFLFLTSRSFFAAGWN